MPLCAVTAPVPPRVRIWTRSQVFACAHVEGLDGRRTDWAAATGPRCGPAMLGGGGYVDALGACGCKLKKPNAADPSRVLHVVLFLPGLLKVLEVWAGGRPRLGRGAGPVAVRARRGHSAAPRGHAVSWTTQCHHREVTRATRPLWPVNTTRPEVSAALSIARRTTCVLAGVLGQACMGETETSVESRDAKRR